jgi:SAM-dependent methyltransferase
VREADRDHVHLSRRGRRLRGNDPASRLLLLCVLVSACGLSPQFRPLDAPFVPSPEVVGLEMLRLAEVGTADVVYDLGSGDGRILIAAARDFGARGVGVELDASLIQRSNENAVRARVADRVSFIWQDLFVADIRPATVITLYLYQEVNLKLRPKLLRELRPGTRVVSHDYDMGEWRADRVLRVRSPEGVHTLHYWVVPADVAGRWQGTFSATSGSASMMTLGLQQRFQHVTGTLTTERREAPLTDATLRGSRLTFAASIDGEAGPIPARFQGRIDGDVMMGEARLVTAGSERTIAWTATRTP